MSCFVGVLVTCAVKEGIALGEELRIAPVGVIGTINTDPVAGFS